MGFGPLIAVAGLAAVELAERRGPFVLFDIAAGDHGDSGGTHFDPAHPPFAAVAAAGMPWVGGILKASQGTRYAPPWFADQFRALRAAGGRRYGYDWFRGAYMFVNFDEPGAPQADLYLEQIRKAGGWGAGDLCPLVDAEQGHGANADNPVEDIVRVVREVIARLKARGERRIGLYHRGVARDFHITDKLGADFVWNPAWTASMVTNGLTVVDGKPGPWTLDDIALWQYCGDGTASAANLPHVVPGLGPEDISVFVDGNRRTTLTRLRERLLRRPSIAEVLR